MLPESLTPPHLIIPRPQVLSETGVVVTTILRMGKLAQRPVTVPRETTRTQRENPGSILFHTGEKFFKACYF